MKTTDYLTEDSPINGQAYALISIVGPHLKAKCDVYGIKIKGVADTEARADEMGNRLQKQDPDFDIFRVPVGKFFPLSIDPATADDTVYQDQALNNLMKEHKQSRAKANEHFKERKTEMMNQALLEGSSTDKPVVLVNKVHDLRSKIKTLLKELQDTNERFKKLPDSEREQGVEEFKQLTAPNQEQDSEQAQEQDSEQAPLDIGSILQRLNAIKEELEKDESNTTLEQKSKELREILSTKQDEVNEYISSNFDNPTKFNF